jgi:prolyl oligopeptidase
MTRDGKCLRLAFILKEKVYPMSAITVFAPTINEPDHDPYLWLEETNSVRARAWVNARNDEALRKFGDTRFVADRDALAAIYGSPGNIPFVQRSGGRLFNFWKDARHPRGLWRATTLDSFRELAPAWEILLDLDALAAKEGEDWVWRTPSILPDIHDRAILCLSRGGSDAVELREFDLAGRDFLPGGFHLPESKCMRQDMDRCMLAWLDRDTVLLASPFGQGMATRSGLARTVRLWRRGTDLLKAPIIFETSPERVSVWACVERNAAGERVFFIEKVSIFDSIIRIGDRSGPDRSIDVPTDASSEWHQGWLAVRLRTAWTIGGQTYGPDTIIGISLARFLEGDRRFVKLFGPTDRCICEDFFWCGRRLVVSILDDLKPAFEILTPSDRGWCRADLRGLPDTGIAHVWPLDVEQESTEGDLLALTQDPLTPPALFLVKPAALPQLLKQAPRAFDPTGLVVRRHEAVSTDGTRVPYVQIGPPGETGEAPVHLWGYGGWAHSQLPAYLPAIGKLWLERGGTSVIANIRGGGEFGAAWHQAGCREGKRLSHDDFAAVAIDLVRRGVTRSSRIAAEGISNGGLLIANMLTRYPELFGGLLCLMPLTDMRRYTKLLEGANWTTEYGDPDNPEDWKFMAEISAYHAAEPGQKYPPILFVANRRDDRVHPGHACKMVAKLQAMGYKAYLYESVSGGHSYGASNNEFTTFIALGYAFLRQAICWDT